MTKRARLDMTFEYDEEQFDELTDERVKDMVQDTILSNPELVWQSTDVETIEEVSEE